jgi:hypothetical protein
VGVSVKARLTTLWRPLFVGMALDRRLKAAV